MEVQAIVGASTSTQAYFVNELVEKAHVPIISFSGSISSVPPMSYLFRAALDDRNQAQAIGAIIQEFGWKQVVPIYEDTLFGQGMIPYLTNALQESDIGIPYWIAISPLASDEQIVEKLYKLKSMQVRVFIVHMWSLGSRFFAKAKQEGMMGQGYVWILTDGMTDLLSSSDPLTIDYMQGVLGVKPYVPKTSEVENFRVRWKKRFHQDYPDVVDAELNINGLWVYDAITALGMAIESVGISDLGFDMSNVVTNNSPTGLESVGVSRNGPKLVKALSNVSFQGLTGDFRFNDGQLQSSTFQIVNVNDNGERGVGFWTAEKGLGRKLNSLRNYSTTGLAPIIWPGDSTSVPKGWEVPINGKKMRIGVPIKDGFLQFVNVTRIPGKNSSRVEGFCIDIFDAALAELPYAITYEYIPFANSEDKSAGTYNDLINQVYLGGFDAAVGDITILVSRSYYVEYTLPYMQFGGLAMIVPIEDHKSRNTWVFFKALTWEVWLTSICFFIFIGFVIWVLEHRINEDFQGPPSRQISTSFWFSFSTMVFADREKVVSNLARAVVIIWCFVGLVLTQSYAAALSSFLTVQQLQPTVSNINELIQKREKVGYQADSFIFGILKRLGFEESQLFPYHSAEECDQLLSKGRDNGGIAAAFHEAPYMNLVLARNCSKYTVFEPRTEIQQFKINGFGFVFPKGSPLAPDVSRAILKLKESNEIRKLEEKWFGKETDCSVHSNSISNRLGLDSFSGLFLIAGMACLVALLTYVAMIAYKNGEVLFKALVQLLRPIIQSRNINSPRGGQGSH